MTVLKKHVFPKFANPLSPLGTPCAFTDASGAPPAACTSIFASCVRGVVFFRFLLLPPSSPAIASPSPSPAALFSAPPVVAPTPVATAATPFTVLSNSNAYT